MTEEHIKFATAKLAKEKGFDDKHCVEYYDRHGFTQKTIINSPNAYRRPTQAFLQRWLREKHKISIKIDDFYTNSKLRYDYSISKLGSQEDNPQGVFEEYEEALEEALQEALKQLNT